VHKTWRSNKIGVTGVGQSVNSIRVSERVIPRGQVPLTRSNNPGTVKSKLEGNLSDGKVPCMRLRGARAVLP
jgi:hypothetical protein